MNPPNPPAYGPNFDYLPAVKPPNEGQRMTLARRYDILWPCWTKEKSGALLRAAMSKFNTSYASFSIFDESCELFKAENGFNQPEINREMSIAAHMLYTNDILVLLDAQAVSRLCLSPFSFLTMLLGLAIQRKPTCCRQCRYSFLCWCTAPLC